MEAVDVRGRFVWHQLMTRDVPGAKQFYAKLAGWKTMPWPLDPSYTVCHADSGPVAGIMQIPSDLPGEIPSHWIQYIGTRDVDATAEAAVRAGGSVVKSPENMAGAGRYALLMDPQGAVFAIIDPENARPEAPGTPPLGAFSWHELATTDHEAAFAFYSGLFGWQAMERMDMGPLGVYLIFGQNGVQRGGIYIKPPDMPAPPNWLPYAHVPNADDGCALAQSAGGSLLNGPMEVPGGSRVAVLMDPTGAAFALHSLPPSGAMAASGPADKPAARPKAKVKASSTAKRKPKTKTKAKAKAKKKTKVRAARKPAAKKQVVRKAARRPAAKKSKSKARSKK
jgi:predicted enzyme related to lactoylglutathione lyase